MWAMLLLLLLLTILQPQLLLLLLQLSLLQLQLLLLLSTILEFNAALETTQSAIGDKVTRVRDWRQWSPRLETIGDKCFQDWRLKLFPISEQQHTPQSGFTILLILELLLTGNCASRNFLV